MRTFQLGRDRSRQVKMAPDRSSCDGGELELSRPGHSGRIERSRPILSWSGSAQHAGAICAGRRGPPILAREKTWMVCRVQLGDTADFTSALRDKGVIKCGCVERGCRLKPAFHCSRNAGFSRQLRTQFQSHPRDRACCGRQRRSVLLGFCCHFSYGDVGQNRAENLRFVNESKAKTVPHHFCLLSACGVSCGR